MVKVGALDYGEDVMRIWLAMVTVGNCDCTLKDAENAWSEYSDSMCAGWLIVEKEADLDTLWSRVEPFIDRERID